MKDKDINKNPSVFDCVLKASLLEAAVVLLIILGMLVIKYVDSGLYDDISVIYKTAVNAHTDINQVKKAEKPEPQNEITAEDITDGDTVYKDTDTDDQSENTASDDTAEETDDLSDNTHEETGEQVDSRGVSYICDLKVDSSSSINSILWPLTGTITSNFGERDDPFTGGNSTHGGIDIAASTGTPVKAAASGTVATAQYSSLYGNYIIIEHSNSFKSVYAHCSSLCVSAGQKVKQGEVIAKSGSTGRSTGPHLHFEIRIGDKKVNPKWLLPEVADL